MSCESQKNSKIMLSNEQKLNAVASAKGLAKWLSIDLSIKIFGVEILSYHFPPKTEEK